MNNDSTLSFGLSEVNRELLEMSNKTNGSTLYKLLEDPFSTIMDELDRMMDDVERAIENLGHSLIAPPRVVLPQKFHSLEDAMKTLYVIQRAVCLHTDNLRQIL